MLGGSRLCKQPPPSIAYRKLRFIKCTDDLAEGKLVTIIDGGHCFRLQALSIEACRVRAIQIGERIAATKVLNDGVDT
jgi:hypothetical protein